MSPKMILVAVLVALALACFVQPAAAAPEGTDKEPPEAVVILLPGGCLWNLARATGTTVAQWVAYNGIENPDRITPGRYLYAPRSADLSRLTLSGQTLPLPWRNEGYGQGGGHHGIALTPIYLDP